MMNQIGASAPSGANDDVVGTTSALVMGSSDPVVAGYNKDEGVVTLLLLLFFVVFKKFTVQLHEIFFIGVSFDMICSVNLYRKYLLELYLP